MTLYILIFLGIIFFSIGIILVLKNVFLVSHYKNQALSLKKKYDETLHEINDQQTRIKNDFKDSDKKIAELSKKLQETTAEKDVQISKLENELAKKQTTSTDNAPAHNDHEIKTLRETLSEKYEIIKQLNEQISDLHGDLQEAEALNIELQNKIDKLTSQTKINQEMSETSRAELSHGDNLLTGIDRSFRMVQRDLMNYQNISAIQEDNIAKLESEVTEMREKAERQGVKLSDEKALELIQNIRSTVVNELPDTHETSQVPLQQGSMMQRPNK